MASELSENEETTHGDFSNRVLACEIVRILVGALAMCSAIVSSHPSGPYLHTMSQFSICPILTRVFIHTVYV